MKGFVPKRDIPKIQSNSSSNQKDSESEGSDFKTTPAKLKREKLPK
jgi:hypothetical protein